jgi:DNA-binding NtrC family response regulator
VAEEQRPNAVLRVDDDRDIAEIVSALLADERFQVSVLPAMTTDAIRVAVNQLAPDYVLLSGEATHSRLMVEGTGALGGIVVHAST